MEDGKRIIKRLLRKPAVVDFLARSFADHCVTDASGATMAGSSDCSGQSVVQILVDGVAAGQVYGPRSDALAEILQVLAQQEAETRALGRESLDRYKELTMLYALTEKIVGARDVADIATVVCQEAAKFLRCDSLSAFVVNAETGRLELVAEVGEPLLDHSTRNRGGDMIAAVLENGVGEIVNDVSSDPRGLDLTSPPASMICSPMKANHRIFGVLVAGSIARRHFNAGELQVLNAFAGQAGAAVEVARLDRDLKASGRKPVALTYGVEDRAPLGVAALLGFQHMLIALLTLAFPVLIAVEAGATRLEAATVVSMSLVAMAIGTVLQIRSGRWIGSGYLAPSITSAIFLAPSLLAASQGGLSLVFGMTIFAGFVAVLLSQVLGRFRKLFPPEVSGVVVLMVGISMVPIAVSNFLGLDGGDALSEPAEWLIGLLTLGAIVSLTVIRTGKIRLYATAIGMTAGYAAAWGAGLFDPFEFQSVEDLPIFGLPAMTWYGLEFDLVLALPFVAAALASNVKDAGLIITFQKANDTAWKRPDTRSMSGGLVAGGLSNIVAGGIGGVGMGVSAGSVGLAIATGAMARNIGYLTALIFLVLAFLPKATAMLALIPAPVMGAGLIYVACHLIGSGTELIASRMLDARRMYVVGLSVLAGVALIASPDLGSALPPLAQSVVASPLATTTILALALNLVMNVGVSNRATAVIALQPDIPTAVARFLDRQGASWGARLDVINRAIPAITEWCEELRAAGGQHSATVELSFDEFQLHATIQPAGTVQASNGKVDIESALRNASRTISRRYGFTSRLSKGHSVNFVFEH